jgi:hypothetical protein
MKTAKPSKPSGEAPHRHRRRFGRSQDPQIEDPYRQQAKPREATLCPGCGAVFQKGRWRWAAPLASAHEALCPACHRIRMAAGVVTVAGDGAAKAEIVNLARNLADQEKAEHPLHRIMAIEEPAGSLVINTTDIHLPRRIGEALHNAYRGDLDFRYDEAGYFIRVEWKRDG